MIEGIVYALVFVFFFIMTFKALGAIRLDNIFKPGHVFEIRFILIVVSLLTSYFICELIDKLLSFGGLSL